MTTPATPRAGRRAPGSTAALVVPAAATLLALMNYTAPMSVLTDTAAGLHAGEAARIWLMSSVSLGLAAALVAAITWGRAGWTRPAGLALSAVGEFAMLGLAPDGHWWRLVPGLAVAGAGSGLANAMLARVAVDSVPADRASMGSGANNTARYVGASVGVAIVGAIAIATGSGDAPAALAHGTNVAMLVSAVVALLGAALALALTTATTTTPTTTSTTGTTASR